MCGDRHAPDASSIVSEERPREIGRDDPTLTCRLVFVVVIWPT
jgi:hypothetical protein